MSMSPKNARPGRSHPVALAAALLAGVALTLGSFRAARAVPAPLSEAELRAKSQLVVLADVLGVACIGTSRTDYPRFAAWLQVIETEKGDISSRSTLQLVWSAVDLTPIGAWEARVYPGDRVRLYLAPAEEAGTWKVFHPQGMAIVARVPAEERQLPLHPGEVRFRAQRPPGASAEPKAQPSTGPSAPPPSSKPQASNRPHLLRTQGGLLMTSTRRTMLSATLALGLAVPLSALAQQEEPRPAPPADSSQDQPGKPGKPTKPTQGPEQGPEQVAIGVIQKIDPKQRTIVIQQGQSTPYQYQAKVKPGQGQKSDSGGVLILVIDDQTDIQPLAAKGMPPEPGPGPKVKPAEPTQGPKVKPAEPTQGPKVKPAEPTQGPKVKPGQVTEPTQQQLSGLQVGQTVRVVYQQQGVKPQAIKIRVMQGQQPNHAPPPPPAPANGPLP